MTRTLDIDGYRSALLAKLIEEAREAQVASPDELPGELADVLEVLRALVPTLAMTWEDLVAVSTTKRGQRGAFERRLFLEYVDGAD